MEPIGDGSLHAEDAGLTASGATSSGTSIVGREQEMEELLAGLDGATAGRGRLILISGEPGIGKSRLADELGAIARERGARVLWGRCWEAGGAPVYWPWVQSLGSYVREVDDAALRVQLSRAAEVAQIVPELSALVSDGGPVVATDPDVARFRLFLAVATFIGAASRDRPIVLILDDLQAADAPSLLLLQFLAGELTGRSVLVVGAYRDVGLDRDHPLTSCLAELVRHPTTRRLRLRGFGPDEVARCAETVTGSRPSEAAIVAIHRETDGNPLFVCEVARLAASEGRLSEADPSYWVRAVPEGVREVIGRRVGRLSKECSRTISLASVFGREFALEALEALSGLPREELEEVIDEAVAARVLSEVAQTPGRLSFAHALIRDTLYDELPPSRRQRLHLRAGEALAELYGADSDPHLAELAHHFFHAGPSASTDDVVGYARRAADRSLTLLAYEEAVRLYRTALSTVERSPNSDPGLRCELLRSLGGASARAGELAEARESYLQAAALARELGRHEAFAHAAMGYGGRGILLPRTGSDPHAVPLLEEALRLRGDEQSELRVRLMARLAGAKRDEVDRAPRDELSRAALEMARRLGDRGTLAYALVARWAAMLGPAHARGRETDVAELLRVAEASGDGELAFEASLHCLLEHLATGDEAGFVAVLDKMDRTARALQQPAQLWVVAAARASIAQLQGRFDEAAERNAEAASLGERSQRWDAVVYSIIQAFALRRERGQLEGMEREIDSAIVECPTRPVFRCVRAALAVELDDLERARLILVDLAADGFAAIPVNNDWSLSAALLAEVIAALGDEARAETLYATLLPSEALFGETLEMSTGSMARSLGLLAATVGWLDASERHLVAAIETNTHFGTRPWIARSRYDLAMTLLRRDETGDRARAIEELRAARGLAQQLGQIVLEAQATSLLLDLGIDAAPPLPTTEAGTGHGHPSGAGAAPSRFRREGDYWLVAHADHELRLQHSKGFQYLAALLSEPGREIHALDLVNPGARSATTLGPRDDDLSWGTGDAGEVLDDAARAAYRTRIEELQADIDEAASWNDGEREARAKGEMDFLLYELAAATGLGGRSRRIGSDAERARVNVTRAIRSSMARISAGDMVVGQLFEQTVRTGTFCVYEPDPQAPVQWDL